MWSVTGFRPEKLLMSTALRISTSFGSCPVLQYFLDYYTVCQTSMSQLATIERQVADFRIYRKLSLAQA